MTYNYKKDLLKKTFLVISTTYASASNVSKHPKYEIF